MVHVKRESRVADSEAERLLRPLLQVVDEDQDLQRAGAVTGGEPQADGVALSPADLNNATKEQHFIFIRVLPQAQFDFFLPSQQVTLNKCSRVYLTGMKPLLYRACSS